jgi:hypothetical protein
MTKLNEAIYNAYKEAIEWWFPKTAQEVKSQFNLSSTDYEDMRGIVANYTHTNTAWFIFSDVLVGWYDDLTEDEKREVVEESKNLFYEWVSSRIMVMTDDKEYRLTIKRIEEDEDCRDTWFKKFLNAIGRNNVSNAMIEWYKDTDDMSLDEMRNVLVSMLTYRTIRMMLMDEIMAATE